MVTGKNTTTLKVITPSVLVSKSAIQPTNFRLNDHSLARYAHLFEEEGINGEITFHQHA